MWYLLAKYEGTHFLDHVPPLTRSRIKGALKNAEMDNLEFETTQTVRDNRVHDRHNV